MSSWVFAGDAVARIGNCLRGGEGQARNADREPKRSPISLPNHDRAMVWSGRRKLLIITVDGTWGSPKGPDGIFSGSAAVLEELVGKIRAFQGR